MDSGLLVSMMFAWTIRAGRTCSRPPHSSLLEFNALCAGQPETPGHGVDAEHGVEMDNDFGSGGGNGGEPPFPLPKVYRMEVDLLFGLWA